MTGTMAGLRLTSPLTCAWFCAMELELTLASDMRTSCGRFRPRGRRRAKGQTYGNRGAYGRSNKGICVTADTISVNGNYSFGSFASRSDLGHFGINANTRRSPRPDNNRNYRSDF